MMKKNKTAKKGKSSVITKKKPVAGFDSLNQINTSEKPKKKKGKK